MNVAIILAGGVGNRVGAGIPKQFIEILGKPILAYTIEPFNEHPDIDAILVVCVKPYIDYIWQLKDRYCFDKLKWVTEGGSTFQESVMNGMHFLKNKIGKEDTVLYHFGASPFITPDIITDVIKVCKTNGTNAISTTDYLLLSGEKKYTRGVQDPDNYSEKYINRDTIAVMNTPHAFQFGFLEEMYKEAVETGVISTVEPHTTTLMYAMGKKIFFSKGNQTNIKITTKDDLGLFEGYVLEKQRNSEEITTGDVVVLMADGVEECEALLVVDLLRRAGLKTIMASVMGRRDIRSSRGVLIQADCLSQNFDFASARLLILPGGRLGMENLRSNNLVKEQCLAFAEERYIAAICSAPCILASLGMISKATVHPDFKDSMGTVEIINKAVVIDNNIITGQGLGSTIPFALKLIETMIDKDKAEQIRRAICYGE